MTNDELIGYLLSNNSAISAIVRALAVANADNPVFVETLKTEHSRRIALKTASIETDQQISWYEDAIKGLLPQNVREQLFPPHHL